MSGVYRRPFRLPPRTAWVGTKGGGPQTKYGNFSADAVIKKTWTNNAVGTLSDEATGFTSYQFGQVSYQKIAQSFTPNSSGALKSLSLYLGKSGSFTTDSISVELQSDSGNAPSGTTLQSLGTIAASSLSWPSFSWNELSGSEYQVSSGTKYWIVASRTGSLSDSEFFMWGASETSTYGGGSLSRYNGSSWSTFASSDLCFKVRLTTALTADAVIQANSGTKGFGVDAVIKKTQQSTIYAWDDFDRVSSNGWGTAPVGGDWSHEGQSDNFSTDGSKGIAVLDQAWYGFRYTLPSVSASDLTFEVDERHLGITPGTDFYPHHILRSNGATLRSDDGYDHEFLIQAGGNYNGDINRMDDGGWTKIADTDSTVQCLAANWIRHQIRAQGSSISVRFWDPDNGVMPETWQSVTDATYPGPGYIGVSLSSSSAGPNSVYIRRVRAYSGDGLFAFAVNAVIAGVTTVPGSFTADAVLKKTINPTFAADAVLERTIEPTGFPVQAQLVRTISGSFSAAAVLKKTISGSFATNAILKKTLSGSLAIAATTKRTQSGSFTSAAILKKTISGSFAAAAVLKRTMAGSFPVVAITKRTQTGSFPVAAIIRWTFAPAGFPVAAWKKATRTGSFAVDVVIKKTIATSFPVEYQWAAGKVTVESSSKIDAVLKKTITDLTFPVAAWLQQTNTGSFATAAVLKRTQSGSLAVDAVLKATRAGSFATNAVLKRTQAGSFGVAAVLQKTGSGSFAVAAVTKATISGSFAIAAITKRTQSGSFSAAAILTKRQAGSFPVAAVTKATLAGSFTSDAVIFSSRTGTFPVAAVIKRLDQPGSFAVAAILTSTQSGPFTADAVLTGTQAGSLSVAAVITSTSTGSFPAQATLAQTTSGSFTLDATFHVEGAGSFDIAAIRVSVGRAMWTTPENYVQIPDTPTLAFTMPSAHGNMHFQMELDLVDTFDSGDLRVHLSSVDQTGWEYWNGGSWQPVPWDGVPDTYAGNEARYTLQTPLDTGTWHRRVRAGVI